MISKEEAEKKLLKIFYDVKLDRYYKKNPTHANIDMFEETKDPDHLEHFYKIKDDELVIAMWANSYEHGIPYFAVNMAYKSAKHWREDLLSKYMKLYLISHAILPFIIMFLGFSVKFYSLFGAILINIIGTGFLIIFIVLMIKWKKRVLIRFRELFETTGIFLSEEKLKRYSKSNFVEYFLITILHVFTIFILFLSWSTIIT